MERARTCHSFAPLRGEKCSVGGQAGHAGQPGQAGQAAIDSLGVITLVVLIVGALMLATTQVAANVEAQLLCAVDSIGTEGGATSCGEPADGTGVNGDEGIVDPPNVEALHMYQVTTEGGEVYELQLADAQVDPSLGTADARADQSLGTAEAQADPRLGGANGAEACLAENGESKGVADPLIENGAARPSPW